MEHYDPTFFIANSTRAEQIETALRQRCASVGWIDTPLVLPDYPGHRSTGSTLKRITFARVSAEAKVEASSVGSEESLRRYNQCWLAATMQHVATDPTAYQLAQHLRNNASAVNANHTILTAGEGAFAYNLAVLIMLIRDEDDEDLSVTAMQFLVDHAKTPGGDKYHQGGICVREVMLLLCAACSEVDPLFGVVHRVCASSLDPNDDPLILRPPVQGAPIGLVSAIEYAQATRGELKAKVMPSLSSSPPPFLSLHIAHHPRTPQTANDPIAHSFPFDPENVAVAFGTHGRLRYRFESLIVQPGPSHFATYARGRDELQARYLDDKSTETDKTRDQAAFTTRYHSRSMETGPWLMVGLRLVGEYPNK